MIRSTYRFRKRPDKYTKEEHDLVVKSNLLEFLAQLDAISMECWERAALPLEDELNEFVVQRGLIKGKI